MVLVGFLPLMVRMVRTGNGDSSLFLTDFSRTASKIPCLTQSVLAVSCLLVLRVTTQRQRSLLALDPFRYWVPHLNRRPRLGRFSMRSIFQIPGC